MIVGFESAPQNEKIFKNITTISYQVTNAIRKTWFSLGLDLRNEARAEILRKPKSGRTYIIRTKSGSKRRHVASAPGETHANLTGKLRRAVSWKVHGAERMDFGYGFAAETPKYDAYVEYGTKHMKPRPTIENAINKVKNNTEDHFIKHLLSEFKRTA